MKNFYFLLIFLLSSAFNTLIAQQDCCDAEGIAGGAISIGGNSGNGNADPVSGCSCLASGEHDSYWFSFVCTSSGSFEMMITPSGLSADFDFALYGVECPCGSATQVVSCDYTGPITPPGPFVPTGIASDPMGSFGVPGATEFQPTVVLTAGTTYYLIADNITTNGAGFDIIFGGTAGLGLPQGGNAPGPSPLTGDLSACNGATIDYSVPNNPNMSDYDWTVSPPTATVNSNGQNSTSITYNAVGTYDVCVTAKVGCNTTQPTCITVEVEDIVTQPIDDIICDGGSYLGPDGIYYTSAGTYTMLFQSYQGCDSNVVLNLTPVQSNNTIINAEVCDGECYSIGNDTYCVTGIYYAGLQNQFGCDSTILLNLIVTPNEAIILGDDFIPCSPGFTLLSGSTSLGGSNMTYEWQNQNGTTIGTDQDITITTAGTYKLITSSLVGNQLCSDETQITITAASPPTATATGGALSCSASSITISGNSSIAGSTFAWAGPGGFNSTLQFPSVSVVGTYTLTVTAPNGCTATATATVTGNSSLPNASATGGTVDCDTPSLTLQGNSTTSGVSYSWTGPGGFTSNQQNPTGVSTPGTYVLTVTAANGCSTQAPAVVSQDNVVPTATAAGGGALTCTNNSLILQGSSTSTGVIYAWTGPGGYTSAAQNPTVTTAGTYVLTVIGANGCSATDSEVVTSDQLVPNVSAVGGTLNCDDPSIELNGNSSTIGATFAWTGPSGFASPLEDPTITNPGTYTLTVSAPNGCTSSTTANVGQDVAQPNASATGGILTCTSGSIALSGSSSSSGITYGWDGPGGYTSAEQNPTVTVAGTYVLTVTAANGCTATSTAQVQQDAGLPDVSASVSGEMTCDVLSVTLSGNSNTVGASLLWTGPGGFTSTDLNPVVNVPGAYTLTASGSNNCSAQALATVVLNEEQPDIEATGGQLTCAQPSLVLEGNSATPGVSYEWAALPSGTPVGNTADVTVNAAGLYQLTITGTNGCTSAVTVQVGADANTPDLSATAGGIDCDQPEAQLSGNSNTTGVTYEWTGPNGFIAQQPDTTTTIPGTYTLMVASPNGCSATQQVVVDADTQAPTAQADGGILSCGTTSLTLMGSSQATGVTWSWTGPGGFTSSLQNPTANVPGTYVLTVTASNGCTASDNAILAQDANAPTATATGGILSCAQTSLQIMGSSSIPGVIWAWTGPNGFTSTQQNPTVNAAGTYTLTVTAGNGCQGTATAVVTPDSNLPNATATGGTLNCSSTGIALAGNSTTQNVTYAWTGPGGFTSTQQNPTVSTVGTYTLTVTSANGCSATATALVNNDSNLPNVSATAPIIDCNNLAVVLDGGSTTPNVTYAWTGPGGFTSTLSDPTATAPGNYTLTVTAPNGCSATTNLNVVQNTTPPNAGATGGNITCTFPSLNLQGSSTTTGVSWAWVGPNGFSASQQNPTVNQAGTYTLTVTGVNGCTATATATVTADAGIPVVTANGGLITCLVASVQLEGASSIASGITWEWAGPGGFASNEQNPTITTSGIYTLTVTTTAGCSSTAQAVVDEDTATPTATIAPADQLDCVTPNTILDGTGSSTGTGISFAWSTNDGSFANGQNTLNPTVDGAGTYTLTLTAANGCSDETSILVTISDAAPNGATIEATSPSCFGDVDGSIQISEVTGGTPPFTYSLEGGPFGNQPSFTNLPPDTYTVTVSDATGCTWQTQVTLDAPLELTLNLATNLQAELLNLGETIDLMANVSVPESMLSSVVWTPAGLDAECPGCLELTVSPNLTTSYSLTVTDENGCTANDQITVFVKVDRPVYVPNAFSPNNDGFNDRLNIFGGTTVTKINSFLLFDRWGETVFEYYYFQPNDINIGWDGKFNGETMNAGVYVWFAEVEFMDGKVELYKGDVLLMR